MGWEQLKSTFGVALLWLCSQVWARKTSRFVLVIWFKKCQSPTTLGVFLSEFLQIQVRKSFQERNQQGTEKDTWCEYIIKSLIDPLRGKRIAVWNNKGVVQKLTRALWNDRRNRSGRGMHGALFFVTLPHLGTNEVLNLWELSVPTLVHLWHLVLVPVYQHKSLLRKTNMGMSVVIWTETLCTPENGSEEPKPHKTGEPFGSWLGQ